jgi:hypothetical protein
MKRIALFAVILALFVVLAPTASPPAQAQPGVFYTAINDTVIDAETLASTWRAHTHPQLRIWARATGSDSIKTNLYVQFRMSGVDTSARVLLDSIIAKGSKYFVVNTGGAQYRIVSAAMNWRNTHVATFNHLKVSVEEKENGR